MSTYIAVHSTSIVFGMYAEGMKNRSEGKALDEKIRSNGSHRIKGYTGIEVPRLNGSISKSQGDRKK